MSIHQPRYSIYRLFDTLTLLVSGKMVYHGPAPNALDYFANIGDYMSIFTAARRPTQSRSVTASLGRKTHFTMFILY